MTLAQVEALIAFDVEEAEPRYAAPADFRALVAKQPGRRQ